MGANVACALLSMQIHSYWTDTQIRFRLGPAKVTSIQEHMDKKPPESAKASEVHFLIETEQEEDGRWLAEIAAIPGVLAYGGTEEQARANAYALALRVIADQVEQSKSVPTSLSISSVSA